MTADHSTGPAAAAAPAAPRQQTPGLERRLGALDAAAIVVSNVVGGGIFFVPILVARLVPSGWAMLAVWLFGGLLAFTGAMAYAELAAVRPRAGGEYVYLRAAYGRGVAFLTGWTSFVAGFSGAIAASAVAFADYLGRFVPAAADRRPLLEVPLPGAPLVVSRQALAAMVLIAALSFAHVHRSGRAVHNLLTAAKIAALVAFGVLGLAFGAGSADHFSAAQPVARPATGWMLALVPVMFTYSGWNAAAYVAEEIRSPGRNVPLALGGGTLLVILIYLLLNIVYLYGLPVAGLAGLDGRLADTVAERLFGFAAGNLLAALAIVSLAASISAMIWAGPRVYYAMAEDGLFFRAARRVHSVHRTPVAAIAAQAVWSSVLVLSGTLAQLVEYTGFAVVLFSGVAVAALFVLRAREPHAQRPFRAIGYPVAPALFVIASLLLVVDSIWSTPATALRGAAVILAGAPIYWLTTRYTLRDPGPGAGASGNRR